MAATVRTVEGDLLDALCHRHYGRHRWTMETVLKANPGLAWLGPVLPAGIEIAMPAPEDMPRGEAAARLWD